jgi:hypothetical protein
MSTDTTPALDYDPFAPDTVPDNSQAEPKPKPKRIRRTRAQIAQDAQEAAALVRSQEVAPDVKMMRQDKPSGLKRVAYSPMAIPIADDVTTHILAIAKGAGVETDGIETLGELFGGINRLSPFAPARAANFLFSVASGSRHREAFMASGLTMVDINVFRQVDEAFGKAYDLCRRLQSDFVALETLDAARDRAVNGVAEAVVGRTGKDQDGQLLDSEGEPMVRVRFSDKLAEVILRATDKRFRDDQSAVGTGGGTVYNIQINRSDCPSVQAHAETGGKRTEKPVDLSELAGIEDISEV